LVCGKKLTRIIFGCNLCNIEKKSFIILISIGTLLSLSLSFPPKNDEFQQTCARILAKMVEEFPCFQGVGYGEGFDWEGFPTGEVQGFSEETPWNEEG
jgi:hypothetical protein